jgi:hypothetical protein
MFSPTAYFFREKKRIFLKKEAKKRNFKRKEQKEAKWDASNTCLHAWVSGFFHSGQ